MRRDEVELMSSVGLLLKHLGEELLAERCPCLSQLNCSADQAAADRAPTG